MNKFKYLMSVLGAALGLLTSSAASAAPIEEVLAANVAGCVYGLKPGAAPTFQQVLASRGYERVPEDGAAAHLIAAEMEFGEVYGTSLPDSGQPVIIAIDGAACAMVSPAASFAALDEAVLGGRILPISATQIATSNVDGVTDTIYAATLQRERFFIRIRGTAEDGALWAYPESERPPGISPNARIPWPR